MMPGSILRFIVGLVLSVEIIRTFVLGLKVSEMAMVLSVAFVFLAALYFIFRF